MKSACKERTAEYVNFAGALRKVLTVSHEETKERLSAEKEQRKKAKAKASASAHVSDEKD
jgi:hypothetical protein